MPLNLSPAAVALLESDRLHERLLLRFDLSGSGSVVTYRFTDDDGTISWNGHDWVGAGQIASVSARGFSMGTSASGLQVLVNGAGLATEGDPSGATLLASILEEARREDAVIITRLHYDPVTLAPVDESDYFYGSIARTPLQRQPVSGGRRVAQLVLEVESDELLLGGAGGRYRSDADQRRMWPEGGGGLHLVVTTAASGQSVFWGQDAPGQSVATAPAFVPGRGPAATAANKLLRML